MRVIAGHHRSRKLEMVNDVKTRETKDRVKESIFNMIGPYHEMNLVLDLFAGSGSLGIEALSRGAKTCLFVDRFPKAVETIRKNLKNLSLESQASLYLEDALVFLEKLRDPFDLIFLDPPYHQVDVSKILNLIHKQSILSEHGLIVVLMDQSEDLVVGEDLQVIKENIITRTKVVFLKATGNDVKRENK